MDIDFKATLAAAVEAERNKDFATGTRLFCDLREHFPNRADGPLGYSRILREQNRLDEADAVLAGAIAQIPDSHPLPALASDFANVGDPKDTILGVGPREYFLRHRKYHMTMHLGP